MQVRSGPLEPSQAHVLITAVLQVFERSVCEQTNTAMLSVDIYTQNDLSIREKLVFAGLAVIRQATPRQRQLHPIPLETLQSLDVVLSTSHTPYDFHVQPVSLLTS